MVDWHGSNLRLLHTTFLSIQHAGVARDPQVTGSVIVILSLVVFARNTSLAKQTPQDAVETSRASGHVGGGSGPRSNETRPRQLVLSLVIDTQDGDENVHENNAETKGHHRHESIRCWEIIEVVLDTVTLIEIKP